MSFWLKSFVFICVTLLSCTIRYSPHAQNELINAYTNEKEIPKEFGVGFSLNEWVIRRGADTLYIPIYPQKSVSLFYRMHQKQGVFRSFAGLEDIIPFQWDGFLEGMPWTFLWIRPNFGGQFELPYMTMRFNIIMFDIFAGFWDNRPNISANLNRTSFYQFTFLLHNSAKFNPYFWLGIRNSSSAIGPLAGIEIIDKSNTCFRVEYSFLKPAPYSFLLSKDELKDIQGSVHYITFGVFKRIK